MTGLTFLSRLTQIAPPYTRFVFLGAGLRLGLPSHPASRRRSCLRLGVSTTSSSRGLSPLSDRPCRAYSRRRLRAPRARRQRRALPLSGPPGTRRATPVKRANRLALKRRRPVRHATVFSAPIVLLAATASRAALRAVASCRPLTQRPLPRVLAPASRTERTRTFSGTAVLTGVSDRWSRAD